MLTTPATTITVDTININIADSTNSNGITGKLNLSNWNDWSVPLSGPSGNTGVYSAALKDYAGTQTTVQVRFNNTNFFVDNQNSGSNWNAGSSSGIPIFAFQLSVLNTTASDTFNIKGIPAGKKVDILWYGGRNSATTRHMTLKDIASGSTTSSILVTSTSGVDGLLQLNNLTPSGGVLNFLISDDTNFWFADAIILRIH